MSLSCKRGYKPIGRRNGRESGLACSIFCVLPKIIYLCPDLSGGSESGRGAKVSDGGCERRERKTREEKGERGLCEQREYREERAQGESRVEEGEARRGRIGLE